jgi:hypothetical protein
MLGFSEMRFDPFRDLLCQGSSVSRRIMLAPKDLSSTEKAQLLFHGSSLETNLKDFPLDQLRSIEGAPNEMCCASESSEHCAEETGFPKLWRN